MSSKDTVQLLRPFQFLLDEMGFRIVSNEVAPVFDNASVVLANDLLNVLIARDRGFVDAEVSSPASPNCWLPVAHLREVVLQLDSENVTLDEQAEFVRTHWRQLAELLSPNRFDDTTDKVRKVGGAWLERKYPGCIRK